jgi:uncharacterized protein YaeQ
VALTATIHTFAVELADSDREVYESLALRVARHPSESEEYLVTRVLAYALELTDGIEFSRGLSDPDEPAIRVRDLTGATRAWIDIGAPDAARLHRACKAAPRVAVYTHRDPTPLIGRLAGERIHGGATLELHALDRALVRELAARLERRLTFALSVADRRLYLSLGGDTLEGGVSRFRWTGDARAFLPA